MPGRPNLAHLTPDQLVAEMRRVQNDLEGAVRYLGEAATILHAQVRRPAFREEASRKAMVPDGAAHEVAERIRQDVVSQTSNAFTLYANTWLRFSGMVVQGIRRNIPSERLMSKMIGARQTQTEPDVSPPARKPLAPVPALAPEEDLVALYGVEMVDQHAQR